MRMEFSCKRVFCGEVVYVWNKECKVEDFKRCWRDNKWYESFLWCNVGILDKRIDKVIEEYVFYKGMGWKKIS